MTALKVLVKGPFSLFSGYGGDSYGIVRTLARWGMDVYVQPTWLDVPIPPDVAPLFTKELRGPFDLTINHWDPAHLGITREARKMTRCAVAWSMWEFAPHPGYGKDGAKVTLPSGKIVSPQPGLVPHCEFRSKIPANLKWFDIFLAYDEVSMASIGPYVPARVARGILQGGYPAEQWKPVEREWGGEKLGYFMHGQLGPRKQPYVTIQAWSELKHERPEFAGAYLNLHTNTPGQLFPEMNELFKEVRIRVHIEAWDKPTLDAFYAQHHIGLFPSRGEGKNLPALEFLSTGGTVIATDFGGHRQWLREDIGYPLPYTLEPTHARHPEGAHDARVSVETLKDAIWHTWTHRAEARSKGRLAQTLIPQMCDWEVVIECLFRRIRDLEPHNGTPLYDQAMRSRERAAERAGAGSVWP